MHIDFPDRRPSRYGDRARDLIDLRAASRIAAGDASVFGFDPEIESFASRFMRWTSLCSAPPFDPAEIDVFAEDVRAEGLDDVVLIGQGGSSQAAMTMSSFLDRSGRLPIGFYTLDVLSTEFLDYVFGRIDPVRTIFIVSSKSGSTLEPMMVFKCVRDRVTSVMGDDAGSRFVAITDPGSKLEQMATELGFRRIFYGEPGVGGRFSALSVFGLVPMSLMGLSASALIDGLQEIQRECAGDLESNPALALAAFLGACYFEGRDKICIRLSDSCGQLGLWLEQLVAESLGKRSLGMMPAIEPVSAHIATGAADRCGIVYATSSDEASEMEGPLAAIRGSGVPALGMLVEDDAVGMAAHMLVWESAVSMVAVLLQVNPFDQPDVESTKIAVREILFGSGVDGGAGRGTGGSDKGLNGDAAGMVDGGRGTDDCVGVAQDRCCADAESVRDDVTDGPVLSFEASEALRDIALTDGSRLEDAESALRALVDSMRPGDYFSANAFLPDFPEQREALESLRRAIAGAVGCVTCVEMGPRFLHSVGQFQKGGPNSGAFLVISAADPEGAMAVPGEAFTLDGIASAQASGDFRALSDRGRRAVHLHLTSSGERALGQLAEMMEGLVSLSR